MPAKHPDEQARNRETRLALWSENRLPEGAGGMVAVRRNGIAPLTQGLGDRSVSKFTWMPMSSRKVSRKNETDASKVLDVSVGRSLVQNREDYVGSYLGHHGIIKAEYDLLEPFTIVDTEAYLKQALKRRISLIMRNGFKVTSDNPAYANYIKDRLDTMEFVTRRPTANLLSDMLVNLSLCSNLFLGKIRNAEAAGVAKKKGNPIPVAGYYIIPAHTMYPYLHKGVIKFWRRYYETGMPYEDYQIDDVIHLKWDVKPGHIFGTPRTIAVRDDIFALRRLEENIELLFINHLFPLYHVKVGTEDARCTYLEGGMSEIDLIRTSVETMPKEGVFVTDERVEVKAVGAEGKSLDPEKILQHMKSRVYTGLGVSSVDMGEGECYDEQTQVLTRDGWKLHTDVDHCVEELGTFNPETRKVEFQLPTAKYMNHYEGEMVHILGDHIDVSVTPNHDMWIRDLKGIKPWKKVKAGNLPGYFQILECAGTDTSSDAEWFELPSAKVKRGRQSRQIRCRLKDFAEFLGYFVSEGCPDTHQEAGGRYRTIISQNCGPKLDKIKDACHRCGFSFSVPDKPSRPNERLIKIYGKNLYKFLEENVLHRARNKNLPEFVFDWPRDCKAALLDALILGDGSDLTDKCTTRIYHTSSQRLADDVQILALSLGYQAKVLPVKDYPGTFGGKMLRVYISGDGQSENYRVVYKHMMSREAYKGTVFCYEVPNHLLVVRRNGKVSIQGNSVNKNSADNISQVLKDALKADVDYFAHQIRTTIFLELFQEAGMSLSVAKATASTFLEFHEIDMDTRIKEENHATDQFNNNAITHDELRGRLKHKPLEKSQEKGLHHEKFAKDLMTHQSDLNREEHDNQTENEKQLSKSRVAEMEAQGVLEKTKASAHTIKTNNTVKTLAAKAKHMPAIAKASANKGKKAVANKARPTNQHGKKLNAKKKSDSISAAVYDGLLEAYTAWDKKDPKEWARISSEVISTTLTGREQTLYTNNPHTGIEDLKRTVAITTDPEMLLMVIESALSEEHPDAEQFDDIPDDSSYIGQDPAESSHRES